MRVLHVNSTFPPGFASGAEFSIYHTCRGLIRCGVECSVLIVNNRAPTPLDEHYLFDRIPVHRLLFNTMTRRSFMDVFDWRIYRSILAELRRLQPDLVHVHGVSGTTLAPYLACRSAGVPVVNTLHDLWLLCANNMLYRQDGSFCDPRQHPRGCQDCFRRYDYWGTIPWRRAAFARLTGNVLFFISPSQALIERHVEAGYRRERFRLLTYGLEPATPEPPQHPAVQEIVETAHQYRTLVFAGGGHESKGVHVLLEIVPLLLRRVQNLRVVVAGGGEDRFLNGFRRYAPATWVLGQVPFKDMRALFASADLTLTPSVWHDNSPVTIYENHQVGTPVVGSNFGGIPELIEEGATGYLFSPGDAIGLAQRILQHFARPAHERRRMRQRSVQEMRTVRTLERHIAGLLQIYDEALHA